MCLCCTWLGNWHSLWSKSAKIMVGFCIASYSHTHIVMPWLCQNIIITEPDAASVSTAVQLCHIFLRSEPVFLCCSTHKKGCFPLKAVKEGRKALRSKEETASSVFWCLWRWWQQPHPEWLMSSQAGSGEQSMNPAAGHWWGHPWERQAARHLRARGCLGRAEGAGSSGSEQGWCLHHPPVPVGSAKTYLPPPYCSAEQRSWETQLDPLALGGLGAGKSNSILKGVIRGG